MFDIEKTINVPNKLTMEEYVDERGAVAVDKALALKIAEYVEPGFDLRYKDVCIDGIYLERQEDGWVELRAWVKIIPRKDT